MQSEAIRTTDGQFAAHMGKHAGPATVASKLGGRQRNVFSHTVHNPDGSRDIVITLKLGAQSLSQRIHISAPDEVHSLSASEEMMELVD